MADCSYHFIASTSDLSDGEMKHVTVGDRSFALYNLGGNYFATDAFCTHGHALLTEGYIEGELIECPMHGGRFEIRTGKAVGKPCVTPLGAYPIRVEGETIAIGLEMAEIK